MALDNATCFMCIDNIVHLVFQLLSVPRIKTYPGTRAFSVAVPTL